MNHIAPDNPRQFTTADARVDPLVPVGAAVAVATEPMHPPTLLFPEFGRGYNGLRLRMAY